MPIVDTDLIRFLSGGNANTDPNAALGGIISATQLINNVDNNFFDDVAGSEAQAGDTEYRCEYHKNNHGSIALQNAKVFIATQTTSADDSIEIGKDPAGVGNGTSTGVATTIANEGAVPSGVTFSSPASYAAGISLGTINAGQVHAVWHKRTVNALAAAINANSYQVQIQGETAA